MRATSVTIPCIISYPNLFTPKSTEVVPDPRFSCDCLIDKNDTATITKIQAAIAAAKQEAMEKDLWQTKGAEPKNLKSPIKDGDERDDEHYKGCWYLAPWSKEDRPPKVVDLRLNPVLDQTEIYGGIKANVSVNFYAYNQKGGKGIGVGFDAGVQKVADGEAFGGGRTSVEDAFGAPAAEEPKAAANPFLM